ncbi:PorV/PorQ family protein [Tenacibaculum sp. UWU-22]|uniref:putative type IX sorting system protein PorV2 n=1 Tax=Tenacibaculum sp. UWU-22 TaxID=3234187 RepID=UPI0034DB5702
MKKVTSLFILLFSIYINGQAFRNYSNEFLNIGVDAAALAMSKTVVATTNDVNAVYWNPAGLLSVQDYQGALMHASYFANIANYDYAAFAMPIDEQSAVGFSLIRFGVDDILNTTQLIDSDGNINYNNISLFSAADYAVTFGYARKSIFKNIAFGANAKIIRRIIGEFATSWGFGFDAGIQFEQNRWKLGLMVRDITTTFNTWHIDEVEYEKIKDAVANQNQDLPQTTEITKPKLQLGAARIFELGRFFNLLAEVDLNMRFAKTNDIIATEILSIDPALGFQLNYDNFAFLRVGIGNFQNTTTFNNNKSLSVQPNFGIGFKYRGIQLDYALTNIGSIGNALYSNIFSLKIDYSFFRP